MASKKDFDIHLGDRVKDRITGYTGIVTCVTEYLNGCFRCGIQPEKLDKDGKVPDSRYFDIEELVVVNKGKYGLAKVKTGGPEKNPVNRTDPRMRLEPKN